MHKLHCQRQEHNIHSLSKDWGKWFPSKLCTTEQAPKPCRKESINVTSLRCWRLTPIAISHMQSRQLFFNFPFLPKAPSWIMRKKKSDNLKPRTFLKAIWPIVLKTAKASQKQKKYIRGLVQSRSPYRDTASKCNGVSQWDPGIEKEGENTLHLNEIRSLVNTNKALLIHWPMYPRDAWY